MWLCLKVVGKTRKVLGDCCFKCLYVHDDFPGFSLRAGTALVEGLGYHTNAGLEVQGK